MKTSCMLSFGAVLVSLCVAGFAGSASARTFSLETRLSPSHLHAVCDQNGGTYGKNRDGSGSCLGKGGNVVTCTKHGACYGTDSDPIIIDPSENDISFPTGLTSIHPIVKDPTPAASALGAQTLQQVQVSN